MKMRLKILIVATITIAGTAFSDFIQPDTANLTSGAIYSETTLTGSKAGPGGSFNDALNGSGLPASYDETSVITTPKYYDVWRSDRFSLSGTVLFSFDSVVDIGSFVLWNSSDSTFTFYDEAGVKDFKLRFFDVNGDQIGSEQSGTAEQGPPNGSGSINPDHFILSSLYEDVKHVEWEILNNYGDSNYLAVNEVGFTTTVPEPATIALFGLFSIGTLAYRRIFTV